MALCQMANADVLRAEIHLLSRGSWWLEAVLDTTTAPSGAATFSASGGLSLSGTIYMSGVFRDAAHVRMAGGADGMGKMTPARAFEQVQARDVLNVIVGATGDKLSNTIDQSILSAQLAVWSMTAKRASSTLDDLVNAVGVNLGQVLTWRFLGDGSLWVGAETYPTATLAEGDDVLEFDPASGLYTIGVTTPSLLPGVNLSTVGKVTAVDHYVTADKVRTLAWV